MQEFAPSAAFPRLTMEPALEEGETPDKISALDAALTAWSDAVDPGSKTR